MKLLTSLNSGSTDYPTFSAGWPVLKLIIRQCLGVKGIGVEIVSLCVFQTVVFTKTNLFHVLMFRQFHQKSGVIVQKLNLFLSTLW